MQDEIRERRQSGPLENGWDAYVGVCYDNTGIFFIRIRRSDQKEDVLQLKFQGSEKHAYELRFFYDDTFK